jgi:hypothetical protein
MWSKCLNSTEICQLFLIGDPALRVLSDSAIGNAENHGDVTGRNSMIIRTHGDNGQINLLAETSRVCEFFAVTNFREEHSRVIGDVFKMKLVNWAFQGISIDARF